MFILFSALLASAASFHRLPLDRQAFRFAFTFFSHCLLQWFYFYCLQTLSSQVAIKHDVAASISHRVSEAVEAVVIGIAKLRKQFPSRYISRAWTRSSKYSSISCACSSSSPSIANCLLK